MPKRISEAKRNACDARFLPLLPVNLRHGRFRVFGFSDRACSAVGTPGQFARQAKLEVLEGVLEGADDDCGVGAGMQDLTGQQRCSRAHRGYCCAALLPHPRGQCV